MRLSTTERSEKFGRSRPGVRRLLTSAGLTPDGPLDWSDGCSSPPTSLGNRFSSEARHSARRFRHHCSRCGCNPCRRENPATVSPLAACAPSAARAISAVHRVSCICASSLLLRFLSDRTSCLRRHPATARKAPAADSRGALGRTGTLLRLPRADHLEMKHAGDHRS